MLNVDETDVATLRKVAELPMPTGVLRVPIEQILARVLIAVVDGMERAESYEAEQREH